MVTLTPVRGRAQSQRWPLEKGFNTGAAQSVYDAIVAMGDDEAQVFATMLAGAALQHTLLSKRAQITAALDDAVTHRAEVMREHLARTAVAKSRTGRDSLPELAALAELVKAFNFSDAQRGEYARRERRDMASGRFAESHVKIGYDSDTKALSREHANQFGIPETAKLSAADRARFQQAYLQLRELVGPYSRMPAGDALLHVQLDGKDGPREVLLSPKDPKAIAPHVKAGEHISSASVSVVPTVGLGGAAYDALAAVGAPRAGATVAGMTDGGLLDPDRLHAFDQQLQTNYAQDDYVPSARVFRNLESGSRLLSDSLGGAAPPKVQMALAVGEQVGRLGPEAQKVIGPTADKAAYRYRGTERAVTPQLANALESLRRSPGVAAQDKREVMLHGMENTDGSGWQPSGVLQAIKRWLPDPGRNELQLKAGKVPPSRGVIFDKDGKTSKEFVGYGDDWYLPFNLKHLKGLRGGEYIRTRTYGGPTTEDIYTGLMTGAKGMAVVSHNGVYTIDFNPDLKGGRRFNDKAAQMVGRYGHLLDAVRSRQVQTGGIVSSRMAELEDQAGSIYDEDAEPVEFRNELTRLITNERKRPKLSRDQELEANLEFFNNLAAGRGDGTGQVTNPDELVSEFAGELGNQRYAAAATAARRAGQLDAFRADPTMAPERFKAQAIEELRREDPLEQAQVVAQALGQDHARTRFVEAARKANAQSVKTLQLNGEGYKIALDALQEQFPYYIDRVEFHEWSPTSRHGEDTGYVRPNRSRPAEALAGFFDPLSSRSGKAKVYADSTRYQNRSTQLRDYVPDRRREPETAPSARSAPSAARDDEAVQAKADQALYEEIRAQTSFGANPSIGDASALAQWAPRDLAASEHRGALEAAAPDLTRFLVMGPDDFAAARKADPAGVSAALGRAREQARETGLLDLDPDVADAQASGGRRELGEHPSVFLGRGDTELALPGQAYSASAQPSADQVQSAYTADQAVASLVGAGLLPVSLADAGFDAKAGELERSLLTQRNQLQAQVSNGMIATPQHWRPIDRPAEGLLRARQLKRRHGEAAQRGVQRPQQMDTEAQVENHVNMAPRQEWESPEDYARTQAALMDEIARRRKQEFDETRTISP